MDLHRRATAGEANLQERIAEAESSSEAESLMRIQEGYATMRRVLSQVAGTSSMTVAQGLGVFGRALENAANRSLRDWYVEGLTAGLTYYTFVSPVGAVGAGMGATVLTGLMRLRRAWPWYRWQCS
jgi:hypothetical protein